MIESPSVSVQRVHDEDDAEVVLSSRLQQHASAGEQDQAVTQLAAHSISDGRQMSALHEDFCEEGTGAVAQPLSQFWQAGDVIGSVRTTADLLVSMIEFNNRRTVTERKTFAHISSLHYSYLYTFSGSHIRWSPYSVATRL